MAGYSTKPFDVWREYADHRAPMAGISTPEMAGAVSNAALDAIGVGATNAAGGGADELIRCAAVPLSQREFVRGIVGAEEARAYLCRLRSTLRVGMIGHDRSCPHDHHDARLSDGGESTRVSRVLSPRCG